MRPLIGSSMVVLLVAAAVGVGAAGAPPLPDRGDAVHLGVASCSASTCHGAGSAVPGGVVRQDEYVTWQQLDKHARAYAVLLEEPSRQMARKLGLERPAHEEALCLDCHADNAPRRDPRHQLSDGVGCESCHGGAERWLEVHTLNDNARSHARNVAAGLYPTEDPRARATLCLSCHFGDETKFVTHRLMGAGHPRLSFELDTFTAIEPAHFDVDDDYRERKRVNEGVQVWAIGQALALVQTLEVILDPKRSGGGLFPELVLFDCQACHKPISANRWQERASLGLGPGVVRLNDANLIMVRVIADVVDPALGRELRGRGRALHRASQEGRERWIAAARTLRASALTAADRFGSHAFAPADLRRLLEALVKEGERGEYIDYVAAEQTAMAIGSILQTMRARGELQEGEFERVTQVMAGLYAAVEQEERYRPAAALSALRRVNAAAR